MTFRNTDRTEFAEHRLVQAVASALAELGGDIAGQRLLAAVSGGPDSVALLMALAFLRDKHGLQLRAFHVNHGLRLEQSDADEALCDELCARLGVALGKAKLNGTVKDEDGLRDSRYQALFEYAQTHDLTAIATGHNLNDQAETLLFRLFRGTSPTGLRGIPFVRRLRDDSSLILVRPLLQLSRAEILEFLHAQALPYQIDQSNLDNKYTRNFIRNSILPAIEERFPNFIARADTFRCLLDTDESFLDEATKQALHDVMFDPALQATGASCCLANQVQSTEAVSQSQIWDLDKFRQLHLSLRRRLVAGALSSRGVQPSFVLVERLLAATLTNSVISLNQEWQLRVDAGMLIWSRREPKETYHVGAEQQVVQIPGVTVCNALGVRLFVNLVESNADELSFPEANSFKALVDLQSCGQELYLRRRLQGDVIQPFGMPHKVRLKKFLHTHKSRGRGRNSLAGPTPDTIVLADNCEVLWVPGIGLSEKLRVKTRPSHLMCFEMLSGR
jgi:tRNA(Ile)-lysidine synthase